MHFLTTSPVRGQDVVVGEKPLVCYDYHELSVIILPSEPAVLFYRQLFYYITVEIFEKGLLNQFLYTQQKQDCFCRCDRTKT